MSLTYVSSNILSTVYTVNRGKFCRAAGHLKREKVGLYLRKNRNINKKRWLTPWSDQTVKVKIQRKQAKEGTEETEGFYNKKKIINTKFIRKLEKAI